MNENTEMMTDHSETWKDYADNSILFSRIVKAGKRIYYIDVKQDRRDEYYISMTESKRVKDGTESEHPIFEKHKIFLYREDLLKFLTALTDATQFIAERKPLTTNNENTTFAENDCNSPLKEPALEAGFDMEF